ncbi:MAG: hypothetical protein ACRDIY_14180, partial [Chloroflexota bacterium]
LSFVALSAAYNVLQPMWEAPDEPAHFGFVRYVQLHHALPTGDPKAPPRLDAWNPVAEYIQVPLYYVIVAAVLSPIPLVHGAQFNQNPYVAWPGHRWREAVALHRTDEGWPYRGLALFLHAGRAVSTAFGLVALLATFGLVWTVTNRAVDGLFATAWLAWTPGFILASSRLNNDAAAMATGALTLFVCARLMITAPPLCVDPQPKRPSPGGAPPGAGSIRRSQTFGQPPWLEPIALAVALSGALLSKLDNVCLLPLAAIALGVTGWRTFRAKPSAAAVGWPALALVVPVCLLLAWWIEIGRTFATRLGTSAGSGVDQIWQLVVATPASRVAGAIWTWNATWWGGVGWGMLTPWPAAVYLALAIPFIGMALLAVVALTDRGFWHGEPAARWTAFLAIATITPLLYFTIARQASPTISLDANARYTLPVASAIALAVVLGARRCPLGRYRRPLAISYLTALLGLSIATAAILLPGIPAPRIPARLAIDDRELAATPLARFANGVDLVNVAGLPAQLPVGGSLSFTVRWRVDATPAADFVVTTQLVDRSGPSKVVGSDRVPFQASFPPRLWQPGEFVDEPRRLIVPPGLKPGVYGLMVGAYVLDGGSPKAIPILGPNSKGGSALVHEWSILPDASGLSTATPTRAAFGDELFLRGYTVDRETNELRVSLFWEVERPITRDFVVSVQTIGPGGRLVSQQDSAPVNGSLPTIDW